VDVAGGRRVTLWTVTLQPDDAAALTPALLEMGLEAYAISSGSAREGGAITLLIAVPDDQAAQAHALLIDYAQTRSETRTAGLSDTATRHLGDLAPPALLVTVEGAIVFRLRVSRYERW
jgi:uncharacterized protein YaaQ